MNLTLHCAHSVEKWKIYSYLKNISSNQLFSNFICNRYFHEIFVKILRVLTKINFLKLSFNTVHSVEKREILSHRKNISSNQLFSKLFSKIVTFTKFLPKMREREFP